MKIQIVLTFLAVALTGCSSTATNTGAAPNSPAPIEAKTPKVLYTGGGLKQLKDLAGKRVREIELWDSQDIDARLGKLLGAEYADMKATWLVESPITADGDILMMAGCEQNNCDNNQYVIFADVAKDNINVQHIKNGATEIYKEKDEIALPKEFADDLAVMKSKTGAK